MVLRMMRLDSFAEMSASWVVGEDVFEKVQQSFMDPV